MIKEFFTGKTQSVVNVVSSLRGKIFQKFRLNYLFNEHIYIDGFSDRRSKSTMYNEMSL